MIDAREGLVRLQRGNKRYASGDPPVHTPIRHQRPFAAIVGCADSRVVPEILFEAKQGELFVIRVAGGIASAAVIGSLEYAVSVLGVPLIIALGHTRCGAVQAAISSYSSGSTAHSPELEAIIGAVRPAIKPVLSSKIDSDQLVTRAVEANTRAVTRKLVANSAVIRARVRQRSVQVTAAVFDVDRGHVRFLPPSSTGSCTGPQ